MNIVLCLDRNWRHKMNEYQIKVIPQMSEKVLRYRENIRSVNTANI